MRRWSVRWTGRRLGQRPRRSDIGRSWCPRNLPSGVRPVPRAEPEKCHCSIRHVGQKTVSALPPAPRSQPAGFHAIVGGEIGRGRGGFRPLSCPGPVCDCRGNSRSVFGHGGVCGFVLSSQAVQFGLEICHVFLRVKPGRWISRPGAHARGDQPPGAIWSRLSFRNLPRDRRPASNSSRHTLNPMRRRTR